MDWMTIIILTLILITPIMAEDPPLVDSPPVIGIIEEQHPITLQPVYVALSGRVLGGDISLEQAAIDAKNAALLGNNSTNGFNFTPSNLTIA